MAHKELKYDVEARRSLEDGVNAVADVAELAERPRLDPRLLRDLAHGGLLGLLALPDQPLRQRPHAGWLASRPDGRHAPLSPQSPNDNSAGREFPLHTAVCNTRSCRRAQRLRMGPPCS